MSFIPFATFGLENTFIFACSSFAFRLSSFSFDPASVVRRFSDPVQMLHLSPCSLSGLLLRASSSVFVMPVAPYHAPEFAISRLLRAGSIRSRFSSISDMGLITKAGFFSLMSCAGSSEGWEVRSCPPAWLLNIILRRSSGVSTPSACLSCCLFRCVHASL